MPRKRRPIIVTFGNVGDLVTSTLGKHYRVLYVEGAKVRLQHTDPTGRKSSGRPMWALMQGSSEHTKAETAGDSYMAGVPDKPTIIDVDLL